MIPAIFKRKLFEIPTPPNWVIAVAIAILCFYVLSVGPAAAICLKYPNNKFCPALEVFYQPLEWLGRNTALGKPLDWYVGLWIQLAY